MKYINLYPMTIVTGLEEVFRTKVETYDERIKLKAFKKAFNDHLETLQDVFKDLKDGLDAGEFAAKKEWNDFLMSGFEIQLMPHNLFKRVRNISEAEHEAIECCFEAEEPKLEPVENNNPPVPTTSPN